jgi:Bifunctional DNA primase/polymerase, N-terminal
MLPAGVKVREGVLLSVAHRGYVGPMTPTPATAPLVAHALRYASEGCYVFPLHAPDTPHTRCSCGLPLGRGPGQCQAKHPRVAQWQAEATRDPDKIRAWWRHWPAAGIGVMAGKSGLFAIDLDVSNGKRGPDAWRALCDLHGPEGSPQVVTTGSGGIHLLYRYTEGITNARGSLPPGVDVRGAGGYIVVPPSLHASGARYVGQIDMRALSDAPPWLLGLLRRNVLPDAPPVQLAGSHALTREDLAQFLEKKRPYPDAAQVVAAAEQIFLGGVWSPHGTRHTVMVALLGALRNFVLDMRQAPLCPESLYTLFAPSLAAVASLPETQVATDREWFLDLYAKLSSTDEVYRGKLAKLREKPNGDLLILPPNFPCADRSWIVGTPAGYFLRSRVGYIGPFSRELSPYVARDAFATAPLELTSAEGKRYSWDTLMQRYGTAPSYVRYAYAMVDGELRETPQGTTFVQRAGVPTDIHPEYNAEIATWLKHLGGAHHEVLLDWLATLRELDKPTCALAILGHSGAGKDLLIEGLSQLWGGKCTPFAVAIGKFNAGLVQSPLVMANEGIHGVERGTSAIDALKDLVSSTRREVAAKYQHALPLDGAVRVVLATNNTGAFKLDKQPNESDLQALHERILLVRPTEEAAPYLVQLGGRAHTEAWVAGQGLARHVAWLETNREVRRGARFLVHGQGGLAALLTAEGAESGPVLGAMLRCLLDPLLGDESVCCARGGQVWVSQANLKTAWPTFGGRHELPDALGDVMATIVEAGSGKMVSVRNQLIKMRSVKPSILGVIAMREGLTEELDEKIRASQR